MTLYVIYRWSDLFETAETRKLEALKWSPSPNKLDGLGYRRMVAQRDRAELFAAWNVMKALASKTTPKGDRGELQRDGRPMTAADMAIMSGFPEAVFTRALDFFSSPEMAWLECRAISPTTADLVSNPSDSPARPADAPASPAATSVEGKGIEGRERNGNERVGSNGKPSRPAPKDVQSDDDWLKSLSEDQSYAHLNVPQLHGKMLRWCEVNRKQPTRRRFINWLNREEQPLGAPTTGDKPWKF